VRRGVVLTRSIALEEPWQCVASVSLVNTCTEMASNARLCQLAQAESLQPGGPSLASRLHCTKAVEIWSDTSLQVASGRQLGVTTND